MGGIDGNAFRRSSRCDGGACIEIADEIDHVLMRDAKQAGGPLLRFDLDSWKSFVSAVRAGKFDA